MNISIFFILYTPVPYFVSIMILYFLSYFRDSLRFMHPRREMGQEIWRDVLFNAGLVNNEQLASPKNKGRTIARSYVYLLSLAAAQPISGWIVSTFVFLSSMLLASALSLLIQFIFATLVFFLVIVPALGSTAHVWKKHVSSLGSSKRRLGSRASHLIDLGKKEQQVEEKIGKRRLRPSEIFLDRGKRNEQLPGGVHSALPPAMIDDGSEMNYKTLVERKENENQSRSRHGVVS